MTSTKKMPYQATAALLETAAARLSDKAGAPVYAADLRAALAYALEHASGPTGGVLVWVWDERGLALTFAPFGEIQ